MKIAIDTLATKSLYHGMGIYTFNLLKELAPIAHEHDILIYKNSNIFSSISKENDNVEIRDITKYRYFRIAWEYTGLSMSLKRDKVDIFWGPSNFLPPIKVCKYIVTIHDLSSITFAHTYSAIRRNYYQYLITNSVRRADFIITDSEHSKHDLINYFSVPENRIRVIFCGISEDFKPIESRDEILTVKQKYELPLEFIFTLGVMEPKKNFERLIEAYSELRNTYVDLPQLVIAGSREYGWKNQKIFQLVEKHNLKDKITFTGLIAHEDLPVVYSAAKLFVLPSLYEGFGLPIIEAMACGVPVVTSNTSSLPEVAGGAAILVNPYDISAIADAISFALKDNYGRKEMIEKGLKNAKRFSWKESAQKVLETFENVCQSK